ncbi:MAG: selenocysteine-specific translation elongation factor [Spirochaetia bacterium]|jgi:selenocysteine-specific elongation factor|nr:selenocysteine-specific translation elongation factor [Spirochaetia bacterium]
MNYIIGTAGHVDHGKTALIKALTGIDTAHLPEEKKRGMTIDLGFAYFNNKDGNPIGVIDVPGHERFIRNMTAGVWSLDCVLLVIAADDGWMQMTTDHLKVVHAMGIRDIILTVTKSDLADSDTLELILEEAGENCASIIGRELPHVFTSALNGTGITELKQLVIKTLNSRNKEGSKQIGFEKAPFIYIDRVFSLQGVGTTITGSLKNGTLSVNDDIFLFPGNIPGKVKGIQSHYVEKERVEPSSRVALKIKLSKKGEARRGMIVSGRGNQVFVEKDLLIKLKPDCFIGDKKLRNHREIELAFGTTHEIGTLHLLSKDSDIATVSLKNEAAFYWMQPGVLIPHGGNSITGSFEIIWSGKADKERKQKIAQIIAARKPETHQELLLMLDGIKKAGSSEDVKDDENRQRIGNWIFDKRYLEISEKQISLLIASNPGGLTDSEISSKTGINPDAVKAILGYFVANKKFTSKNNIYNINSDAKAAGEEAAEEKDLLEGLSANAKKIYDEAVKAGKSGISLSKMGIEGSQKESRNLVRLNLLVHLEDKLYYSRKTYEKVKKEVLSGLNTGDKFQIDIAKEKTKLSRKYIIPVLNQMEKENLIRREEDHRIVL